MPVQRTFTIVPAVARDASPVPALTSGRMTSKQVREAYKAANKGPRMSRAERLKWEREEQQRIRKEMEREKAAAKAKLLRDKKKEKEKAEMEVKRKEGKPLVKVRPSQDTIARFVRGNGMDRKRECGGDLVSRRTSDQQAQPLQPTKPETDSVSDGVSGSKETLDLIAEGDEVEEEGGGPGDATESINHVAENIAAAEPSKEPATQEPTAVHTILGDDVPSDLLKSFESSLSQRQEGSVVQPTKQAPVDETLAAVLDGDIDTDLSQDALSGPRLCDTLQVHQQLPRDDLDQLDALLDEDIDLDDLDELDGVCSGSKIGNEQQTEPCSQSRSTTSGILYSNQARGSKYGRHQPTPKQAEIPTNPTESPPVQSISKPKAIRNPESSSSPLAIQQPPPLSTQAIMLNLEDFFPSASQQARELDDDFFATASLTPSLTPRQAMPPPPAPRLAGTSSPAASQRGTTTPNSQMRKNKVVGVHEQMTPQQPTPSPKRWFTASGSKELESLVLQRSRRTAALDEIRQRERGHAAGWPADVPLPVNSCHSPRGLSERSSRKRTLPPNPSPSQGRPEEPPVKKRCSFEDVQEDDGDGKENVPPEASQETDYGGGWIEDFEL